MTNRPFFLLIKPTSYQCNLRCDYCFYLCKDQLFKEKELAMSDAVLERIIQTYMETQQRQYNICWQGGEPTLMGLNFYKKVTDLQMKYGKKGAVVANALQTNATMLDDKWARYLHEYQYLVGVSLDGTKKMHDVYRKNIHHQGTHASVLRGIAHLKKNDVAFNVLTLVNADNVHKAKELYSYLRKEDYPYLQFTPCVEFDDQGALMPYAITGKQWGQFLIQVFDLWLKEDVQKVAIRNFDAIIEKLLYNHCSMCTMGNNCGQYLVVEHNGDVFPCDFFVEETYKLGNIMQNSWEELLANADYQTFAKAKENWNITCQQCPYLRFCQGDCLKNRYGEIPGFDNLSWLCEGWKMFYAHALPQFMKLIQ